MLLPMDSFRQSLGTAIFGSKNLYETARYKSTLEVQALPRSRIAINDFKYLTAKPKGFHC
jgi:hypothetical protein